MLEELQSLYHDSGTWGDLILSAEAGLIITGIVMLYTVKQAIKFFLYLLTALIPILLGLFGYIQFSGELAEMVQEGLETDIVEHVEEALFKPIILGAIAVVIPLLLGFIGLRRVRRASHSRQKEPTA